MIETKRIDGRALSGALLDGLGTRVAACKEAGVEPCLAVFLVGEDPASQVYVRNKGRKAEAAGIDNDFFVMMADAPDEVAEGREIFVKHCVACHVKNKKKRAPDLSKGDISRNPGRFFPSYNSLRNFAFFVENQVWTTPLTIPGKFGARASKLYAHLTTGSHKDRVKLSAEEMHRITLWLDANSDFFGSYKRLKEQVEGKVVPPTLE